MKIDGLDLVPYSWPKAIHEGNGNRLSITKKASEDQRKASISIFSGQAKGEGPFALFAGHINIRLIHSLLISM